MAVYIPIFLLQWKREVKRTRREVEWGFEDSSV